LVLFIILFAAMVVPPFWRAAMNPKPSFIKEAVKRGVLALIVLNAALAAGFGGITMGLLVLILLPLSILLSNLFAVTCTCLSSKNNHAEPVAHTYMCGRAIKFDYLSLIRQILNACLNAISMFWNDNRTGRLAVIYLSICLSKNIQ